jgi:hypothetical protein
MFEVREISSAVEPTKRIFVVSRMFKDERRASSFFKGPLRNSFCRLAGTRVSSSRWFLRSFTELWAGRDIEYWAFPCVTLNDVVSDIYRKL